MEMDQGFLEHVVKSLVDYPDDVHIVRTVDEMGVLLTLDVNAQDMGKVIGRAGNTAKAIRTLLRVVGMKNNARVNLKVNEPQGGSAHVSSSPVTEEPKAQPTIQSADVDEVMADLRADEE